MFADLPEVEASALPDPLPDGMVVVDVREPEEWDAGHIDGAVHIPMMQVPERFAELPEADRFLVVCKVGARSARVTMFLQQQGVDAVNLAGGMAAWEWARRPMVAEHGQPPYVA